MLEEISDGGWGWACVAGSALSHFLVVGLGRSFGVFFQPLKQNFQQSSAATSFVVAIFNFFRMFFGPLVGEMCDKYSCRKVVIIGSFALCLGCVLSAFATNLLFLYLTFGALAGCGAGMIFTPSYVIVGKYFNKKKGKAMAIATIGTGVGSFVFAPLIGWLLLTESFYGTMIILGGLQLNNLVAAALYRPVHLDMKIRKAALKATEMSKISLKDKPHEPAEGGFSGSLQDQILLASVELPTPKQEVELQEDDFEKLTFKRRIAGACDWEKYCSIVSNLTFMIYGFQMIAMAVCIQTYLYYLPAFSSHLGYSVKQSSWLLSIVGISDMVGRFFWGFIFDIKFIRHRRRILHGILGIPVSLISVFNGFMTSYIGLVILALCFGFFEGGFHGQRATIVNEFVDASKLSYTVGFVIFFQGFGNLVGPPVAGIFNDLYDRYDVCYYYGGICLLFSTCLFCSRVIYQIKVAKRIAGVDVPVRA